MIEVTVKQNEIESCSEDDITGEISELVDYFQEHMSEEDGKVDFLPYDHQYKTFEKIMADEEVLLTAGTSAGKTLAHSVPLFYKVKQESIDKVLLLYPTRALLQDQREEMNDLAEVYGLQNDIAEIKGGMNRSQVIKGLNKKIIIATPDSIYWFFNKNIKYNSLLIYALSQIDEVVIDEAHLFSGLVLNNLIFLIERMKKLAKKVGTKQRYHILTATANQRLKDSVYNNGVKEIDGNSNCGSIRLELKDKKDKFSGELFESNLEEFVEHGEEKSCVTILNSAKVAHQLFYKHTKELSVDEVPEKIKEKFTYSESKLSLGEFLDKLPGEIEGKIKQKLNNNLSQLLTNISLRNYLETKQNSQTIRFENEKLFAVISDYLEEGYRRFERIIEQVNQQSGDPITNMEEQIARDDYVKEFYEGINLDEKLSPYDSLNEVKEKLNDCFEDFKQILEIKINQNNSFILEGVMSRNDNPYIKAEEIKLQQGENKVVYFASNFKLGNKIADRLTLGDLEEEDLKTPITLQQIEELELEAELLAEVLGDDFNAKWLDTTNIPRYLAHWEEKSDLLVILYTGSMPNHLREGLVELFNEADYEKKILISTSAVEVGVDFEADFLITEETNAASFLQRFGRIGRNGKQGRVRLFLTSPTFKKLDARLTEDKVKRDQFSDLINEVFDQVKGIDSKEFLVAYHWIVNENLGRIGQELNQEFGESVQNLGSSLRENVELNYGLRGTMPSVALRGGVSKNPFYMLRFLDNGDLEDTTSPFEVAQTDKSFDSIIWDSYAESEEVYVDIDETLNYSKLMFTKQRPEEDFIPHFREGICARYEREFLRKEAQNNAYSKRTEEFLAGNELKDRWKEELESYDQRMLEYLLSSEGYKYILGFGDIYLKKDSGPIFVEDKRLVLPNQFFLLLVGEKKRVDNYVEILQQKNIFDYKEVIVDDTNYNNELNEEHKARNPLGIVMLETINGALFDVYDQLLAATKAGEL